MNKRQLSRVISLYRDGVSPQVCTSTIIAMSRSSIEASVFIDKFYNSTVLDVFKREIQQLKDVIRGQNYEQSLNRPKPSLVED